MTENAGVDGPGLYPGLLGRSWLDLDPAIRRLHFHGGHLQASGIFELRHGPGVLARIVRWLWRLPASGRGVQARLVIMGESQSERWVRTFGDRSLITTQRASPDGNLAEQTGPLELRFRLEVAERGLTYRPAGAGLTVGRWRIRLPGWMSPRVDAREERPPAAHHTHVRVTVSAPLTGLVLSYEGLLDVDETR
jgi:hypothetical protein